MSEGALGSRPTRRSIVLGALCAPVVTATRARAGPSEFVWFPFDPSGSGFLAAPARIGEEAVEAVLDTASTRTVVDVGLADRLSLVRSGTVSGTGLAGKIEGTVACVPALYVAGVSIGDVEASCYDLSALDATKTPQIVLGQDVLSRLDVVLQFSSARLGLRAHDALAAQAGGDVVQLKRSPRRLPLVSLSFEGRPATTGIVDFGSDIICTMSRQYAIEAGLLGGRPVSNTLTVGPEGAAEALILSAREIRLDGYTLRDVPVRVIDEWQRSSQVDIGWPFFQAFDLVLELGEDRLWLRTDAERLRRQFPKDRSGLAAARTPNRMVVRHVSAHSPADAVGLHAGDEIVSIDGRAIDARWPPAGERLGRRPAGTILRLGLADGRCLELVLADYF